MLLPAEKNMTSNDVANFLIPHVAELGLTVAGAVAAAYGAFKHFGEKWLENKFEARLEAVRHSYALEVARSQVKFDALLTAHIREQENDFKLLPEAWKSVDDAFGLLNWVVSPVQNWPLVTHMNQEQLEELLKASDFMDGEKQKIRFSTGSIRLKTYIEIERVSRLNTVYKANKKLMTFISSNGIFLQPQLKSDLKSLSNEIHQLANRQALNYEDLGESQGVLWDHFNLIVRPIYERIETAIEGRLRSYSTPPGQASASGSNTL